MNKFCVGECVYIKSTKQTGIVLDEYPSSMGHAVYKLDTNGAFNSDYPFFEEDLESIDAQLEANGYNDFIDAAKGATLSLEEKEQAEEQKYKFDAGKLKHSLLVPEFIEELLGVLNFGADKYEPGSWRNVSETRYSDAMYRHYLEYLKGGDLDVESTYSHMAHIAANAMFIFWKIQQEKTND